MNVLEQITEGKVIKPRKTMIYGDHGIGKSTFAATAPKPVFIQTEDGLNDIDCAKFPICREYSDVTTQLKGLIVGDHDYQTVAIDSLDWLETLVWADVCTENKVANIEKIGYGKGYILAVDKWKAVLQGLEILRGLRQMNVVLVAHAKVEKVPDPMNDDYRAYFPDLNKHASSLICEWCDEIFFACQEVYTKADGEQFGQSKRRAVSSGTRIMFTEQRPYRIAKNRLSLPEKLPLSYQAYADYINPSNKEN
jgi:hypothetical protein